MLGKGEIQNMEKQLIISISREYGSAGHEIAEALAKDLGISLYDRNLLDHVAEEKEVNVEHLAKYDEQPVSVLFTRRVGEHTNSMEDHIAQMQFEFIKKKADSGESFVVVGRCAETILKNQEGLISIFVLGDRDKKLKHIEQKYSLSEQESIAKMNRHDKKRKLYHNRYSDFRWGDSRGYDVCINSSRLGIDGTLQALKHYIELRQQ